MADTYTLPALTAADINGIVTAGQDGTYNITYTNLTANQIAEIGTAFEVAMQKNLKSVALSGNYSELENKPSASNLQGFHQVAFSGDYNSLDSNTRPALTNWPNTKPAFHEIAFSGNYNDLLDKPNLDVSANNSSINGLARIAISGNYEDLNNAPALPEDTENNSKAYYTINEGETNEERKIKSFNLISFTGDYNDLSNKPNNLYIFLNLQNFSNIILPSENLKLQTLGESNNYILDFNHFQNSNNILLSDAIKTLATYYYNYSKECVIINTLRRYNIINIKRTLLNNDEDNVSLISMDYIAFNNNNYETIRYNGNSFDETVAAQQLDDLIITKQTGTLFFDYQNNVIYCKINNI